MKRPILNIADVKLQPRQAALPRPGMRLNGSTRMGFIGPLLGALRRQRRPARKVMRGLDAGPDFADPHRSDVRFS